MNSLIPKICDELNVKVHYPFKAKMPSGYIKLLKFRDKGLYIFLDGSWEKTSGLIYDSLLSGDIEVINEQ